MNDLQHIVQQLARPAHKGHPLLILVLAGALADEHDLRRFRAVPEHHVGPGIRQGAAPAVGAVLFQRFPAVCHVHPAFRFFLPEYTTPIPAAQAHKRSLLCRY